MIQAISLVILAKNYFKSETRSGHPIVVSENYYNCQNKLPNRDPAELK